MAAGGSQGERAGARYVREGKGQGGDKDEPKRARRRPHSDGVQRRRWFNACEGREGRNLPWYVPEEHRPLLAGSQSCELTVAQPGPRGGGGRVQALRISVSSETISSATCFAKGNTRCSWSERLERTWSYLFCSFNS